MEVYGGESVASKWRNTFTRTFSRQDVGTLIMIEAPADFAEESTLISLWTFLL
jgi:hypothetical protein